MLLWALASVGGRENGAGLSGVLILMAVSLGVAAVLRAIYLRLPQRVSFLRLSKGGHGFWTWSLFATAALAAVFSVAGQHHGNQAAAGLEACSFKSRTLPLVLAATASPSECAWIRRTVGAAAGVYHGAPLSTRCAFKYPARDGWTFSVEASDAEVGQAFCTLESRALRGDGWVIDPSV